MCLIRNMHQVEQVGDEYKKNDEGELQFSITSVNKCNVADKLFVDLYLHPFHFFVRSKVDSGAEVNILPKNIWDKYDPKAHLNPIRVTLSAFGGGLIKPLGYIKIRCKCNDVESCETFYVVDCMCSPILCLHTCLNLNLIKILFKVKSNENTVATNYPQLQCLLNAYINVLDSISCLDNECHIFIDCNVAPTVCPPHHIPFAIQEKVKLEWD